MLKIRLSRVRYSPPSSRASDPFLARERERERERERVLCFNEKKNLHGNATSGCETLGVSVAFSNNLII
jgi:hypothetical protein